MSEEGMRVIAISHADKEKVYIFGYGVYEGDFPNPNLFNIKNPRIKLDSGEIVWGNQCWWGSENSENYKNLVGNRQVVVVAVPVPN